MEIKTNPCGIQVTKPSLKLEIKKLSDNAIVPTYGSDEAAGLDLYAAEDALISKNKVTVIRTGIAMAIPKGYAGLIWPRSGMAVKNGIDTLAGVIDSDYRGEIMVALTSHLEWGVEVAYGSRIAQILIQPVSRPTIIEVDELSGTDRGEKGFGSTGV